MGKASSHSVKAIKKMTTILTRRAGKEDKFFKISKSTIMDTRTERLRSRKW